MSVRFTITLKCDGKDCARGLDARDLASSTTVQVAALRRRAAIVAHWRRFRPNNTAKTGDYCPDCAAKLRPRKGTRS